MIPEVHTRFECADPAIQRLYDEIERRCRLNLRDFGGRRVLVEGGGYEKIWLETQPMGGEMYALRDMEAAMHNSLLFMEHQRPDGRLPGSIQCVDGRVVPQYDKLQGFCFPAHALNLYFLMGRDGGWLDALFDCLRRFDDYLWKYRAVGDGLLGSFCVYDTGEDNAARYGDAPCWWPEDAAPTGYRSVPMASMDVTSYSYACRDALAAISRLRGAQDDAAAYRAKAGAVAHALRGLWDDRRGTLFDRDSRGERVDVVCHNPLRCMYWGSLAPELAGRFVREHLMNPREFWTPMPLPSVAADDPAFVNAPENNWSGQCQGLTYQRSILALENYGYEVLETALGKRLIRALIDGGYVFSQQFDPFTGAPSRVGMFSHAPLLPGDDEPAQDAYGPTMLAALGYLERLWGISLHRGRPRFSLCGGLAFQSEVRIGDDDYRLEGDGVRGAIWVNGREIWTGGCGVRVALDGDGHPMKLRRLE